MKVKSEDIVDELTIRERSVTVTRTSWRGRPGLSFDLHDKVTGLCLTQESVDEQPDAQRVEELIEQLADDFAHGVLNTFYVGQENTLREALGIEEWGCEGCGTTIATTSADMVVDHVRDCDEVDGAGNAL